MLVYFAYFWTFHHVIPTPLTYCLCKPFFYLFGKFIYNHLLFFFFNDLPSLSFRQSFLFSLVYPPKPLRSISLNLKQTCIFSLQRPFT